MIPNFAQTARPRLLSELVGQPTAVALLQPQLESGAVGPVLLLAGPRGSGKTSTARAIAAALNCEVSPGLEPCGQCRHCQAMARVAPATELYSEVDGGTSGSVEAVRSVVAELAMPVPPGRSRVLVIDEAHLLSGPAASALLKTLEEPPPGVVIVLATTDPQRLLPTIRSRCLEIPFVAVAAEAVAVRVAAVAAEAELELEGEAVLAIAENAQGDLRRAMKLLQGAATAGGAGPLLDTASGSREVLAAQVVAAAALGDLPSAAEAIRLLLGGQGQRRLPLDQAMALLASAVYRLSLMAGAGAQQADLAIGADEWGALAEALPLVDGTRAQAMADAVLASWQVLAGAPLADEPALGLVALRLMQTRSQPAARASAPAPAAAAPAQPVASGAPPADAQAWANAIAALPEPLGPLLQKAELVSIGNGLATLKATGLVRQRLKGKASEVAAALGLALELVG